MGGEKEDYQRTIQFWEQDGVVVRMNFIAPKTAYYKEPGGMQEGDRVAKQKKTVKAMLKRWPKYIRENPSRKSGFPEIRLVEPKEVPTNKRKSQKKKKTAND
jgi:hypothetical protein